MSWCVLVSPDKRTRSAPVTRPCARAWTRSGPQGNGTSIVGSRGQTISSDGRFVVLNSASTNLVPPDQNPGSDMFVKDLENESTELVSLSSSGTQANALTGGACISANGRLVAFGSPATNLVPGDTNNESDIFLATGSLSKQRASTSPGTERKPTHPPAPSRSPPTPAARFLQRGDQPRPRRHQRRRGRLPARLDRRLDRAPQPRPAGAEADGPQPSPSISADGRCVAFESDATNLVPGDTNGCGDVFVLDRQTGAIERVSVDSTGAGGDSASSLPSISADGRFVVFNSRATNLVPGDGNRRGHLRARSHERHDDARQRLLEGVEGDATSRSRDASPPTATSSPSTATRPTSSRGTQLRLRRVPARPPPARRAGQRELLGHPGARRLLAALDLRATARSSPSRAWPRTSRRRHQRQDRRVRARPRTAAGRYCAAQTNSLGCVPAVALGAARATSAAGSSSRPPPC